MSNFSKKLQEATEKELYEWVNNLNPVFTQLASDELTRRSNEKYSKEIIGLTYGLVFLTIILAAPLFIEFLKWLNQ